MQCIQTLTAIRIYHTISCTSQWSHMRYVARDISSLYTCLQRHCAAAEAQLTFQKRLPGSCRLEGRNQHPAAACEHVLAADWLVVWLID